MYNLVLRTVSIIGTYSGMLTREGSGCNIPHFGFFCNDLLLEKKMSQK